MDDQYPASPTHEYRRLSGQARHIHPRTSAGAGFSSRTNVYGFGIFRACTKLVARWFPVVVGKVRLRGHKLEWCAGVAKQLMLVSCEA